MVHTKGRIPSFILTLSILITYWGLTVTLSGGYPRPIKGFDWITASVIPRVPTPFLWSIPIVLAAIIVVLRTRLGIYFWAIGSNEEGVRLAGIDVDRYKIIAFMLSGTFTGIGSIILFAHLGGSAPVDFNMNNVVRPLVAIILGGTSMAGGSGGPHRTILGVFTFSILYRGLYLSALRPEMIDRGRRHRAHPVRHHQLQGYADEGGGYHMSEPCASPTPVRIRTRMNTTTIMPVVATVVVVGIFQMLNPSFLSYQGIVTIVYAMSYFLIAACGLTLVIMMGSFDFSVVAVMKLSALLCVLYIEKIGLWIIPLALAMSALIGLRQRRAVRQAEGAFLHRHARHFGGPRRDLAAVLEGLPAPVGA